MPVKGMSVYTHQGEDYTVNDPNIAGEFSASQAYTKGQFVYYQGDLWKFTEDHSAGAWNGNHVTKKLLTADYKETKDNLVFEIKNAINTMDHKKIISFSDLPVASENVYVAASTKGQVITTNANANHKIVYMPGRNVTRISFTLNQSAGGLPIITVVEEATGITLDQYAGNEHFLKGVRDYPKGLGEGTRILINWFGGMSQSSSWMNSITVEYKEIDDRVEMGRNKFNKDELFFGEGYLSGGIQMTTVDNARCVPFAVKAGDVVRIAGTGAHITFFKGYNDFISGAVLLPGDTVTVPSLAEYALASFSNANDDFKNTCIITLNDTNLEYAPYTYKFINSQENGTGDSDRFEPYTSGQIHFTVPINQTTLENGQDTATIVDSEDIVDVNAVLMLPLSYSKDRNAVPLIIICHGSGFGVSANNWGYTDGAGGLNPSEPMNQMVNGFLNAGYAVCDINGYNNTIPCGTWGATKAVYAYRKLYEYVIKKYNLQHQANVYGFSMGGIVALNFMLNNRDIVKALEISAPLTHLYSQVYSGHAHWKEQMATAFGFDGVSSVTFTEGPPTEEEQALWDANESLTIGFDPAAQIITMDETEMILGAFPPIRAWHGKNDSAVAYTFTQRLINALRNGGNNAQIRLVSSAGHEICYGDNLICNAEYVMWFDRFNIK